MSVEDFQTEAAVPVTYPEVAGKVQRETVLAVIMAATIRTTAPTESVVVETGTQAELALVGNRKPAAEIPREHSAT